MLNISSVVHRACLEHDCLLSWTFYWHSSPSGLAKPARPIIYQFTDFQPKLQDHQQRTNELSGVSLCSFPPSFHQYQFPQLGNRETCEKLA